MFEGITGLFDKVFQRLDTRYEPKLLPELKDPKTGAKQIGYFKPDGTLAVVWQGLPDPKFPPLSVFSAASMIAYIAHHANEADGPIEMGRSILAVNQSGLHFIVDYGGAEEPERREHKVTFPASFDEECSAAAGAIKDALGRWIALESFDQLLDKCAPFIGNFAALESATSNMEGHESAKIAKTATSFQVQVIGEVACAVDIPKAVSVRLMFMGNPIEANIPLRLTVKDKQVLFHLVDNGAIAKAQMEALRKIKAEVVSAFPALLVIDGTIG